MLYDLARLLKLGSIRSIVVRRINCRKGAENVGAIKKPCVRKFVEGKHSRSNSGFVLERIKDFKWLCLM